MPVSERVRTALSSSSLIRRMFEEGIMLKKKHGSDKVFDFSLGNPDIEPPAEFRAVLAGLAAEKTTGTHGYMPNAGFPEARAAMAAKASLEHGASVSAEHIVMSCGAAGALNTVFRTILNPGDEIIVPKPYFLEYRAYTANHGGVLVEVRSAEDFNLDVEAVKEALNEKTAAVLINSPHNPTGRVYSSKIIESLASLLEAHGRKTGRYPYLIADEPYRELVYDGIKTAPILSVYRNSVAVTSYSKSLSLPGERIGYIACAPDIEERELFISALSYATRVLGFVNAPALMQRCVERLTECKVDIEIYARRRQAFMEVLDRAGLEYAKPEGAFYLFVKVPVSKKYGNDDTAFCEHLKKFLVLGVPGTAFGTPGRIRFAYCTSESVIRASAEAFLQAVETW